MKIAGFDARLVDVEIPIGDGTPRLVKLWEVDGLERYVDAVSLLREPDPVEPPYWALLWSGAHALARAVWRSGPVAGRRVLDVGAGLGLAGISAALGGARVTFMDKNDEALEFVRASARENGLDGVEVLRVDFTRDRLPEPFDLVLAADVVYDRAQHRELAEFVNAHVAPGGEAWITDRMYVGTDAFFAHLAALGFEDRVDELDVPEMGDPMRTRLHRLTRRKTS